MNVVSLGHKVMFGSGIIPSDEGTETTFTSVTLGGTESQPGLVEAMYNLIMASDAALPAAPSSFLDVGIEASETLKNWKAAVAQRDGNIQCLQGQLAEQSARLAEQSAQLLEKDARLAVQCAQLVEKVARLAVQSAQLVEKDARLAVQSAQLVEKDARLVDQGTQLAEQRAQADEYLYHLDRINAWGWFRLGLFLDRLIRAPLRLVAEQRSKPK